MYMLPLAVGDVPLRVHQLRSATLNSLIEFSLDSEDDENIELDIVIQAMDELPLVVGAPTYLAQDGILTVDITEAKPDEIRISDTKLHLTCKLDDKEYQLDIPIGLVCRVRLTKNGEPTATELLNPFLKPEVGMFGTEPKRPTLTLVK